MKEVLDQHALHCTGCTACLNTCPFGAIAMQEDRIGSRVAVIDKSICTDCGKCEAVCPLLSKPAITRLDAPRLYAVWADGETRMKSTSGGAFSLIANSVLSRGGVVYAVEFDEEFHAKHHRFMPGDDLAPARGSKYVQSDPGDTFASVKADLEQGSAVCYVGLPCQIAGLNAYLAREYESLLTVDMLCSFVPPDAVFQKYLKEDFDFPSLGEVRFRSKEFGWFCDVCRMTYRDGSISFRREANDYFQKGYHQKLYMPAACESCHFSGYPKQGDITIGDLWYIEEFDPALNDAAGTSAFLVNSDKGMCVLEETRNKMELCKEVPLSALDKNRPVIAEPHPSRDRFYALLERFSFDKAVDYALHGKYDVGVLGVWSEDNYGSEITYYALYRFLKDRGYEVLMIERPARSDWAPNERPVLFRNNPYEKDDLCALYDTVDDMHDLNNRCDAFVLGSDQMWHDNLFMPFGQFGYLDYIHENKNKIAYATSFGKSTWDGTEEQKALLSFYLERLNSVSVREQSGVEICEKVFGRSAQWNLDPVFLCGQEAFRAVATERPSTGGYIASYMLDVTEEKQNALRWISAEKNLPLEIISDARNPREALWSLPVNTQASTEDWLSMMINAEFVVTDSFHGMCFATLFHKPFFAFINETRGATRFLEYLNLLGLEDRMLWNPEDIADKYTTAVPIDWDRVDEIIETHKGTSSHWLIDAIDAKNDSALSLFDVLGDRVASVGALAPQVIDNAGMIQHHENVFRDAFGEIEALRKELEEFKADMSRVSSWINKMRNVKRKFR